LQRVAFSRHLNPTNAPAARRRFRDGAEAPPFEYQPLVEADALLRELDAVDPPRDHPAGMLVGRCIEGTCLLIRALRDRTAEAFDALNTAADWYPDAALMDLRFPAKPGTKEPMDVTAKQLIDRFRSALDERDMAIWQVEEDAVMSARVLVDSAKRIIRVRPDARFRTRDLSRLVVHELDVHARRSVNGSAQILRCFSTGLPGSLSTEEGLAMVAEEESGTASPGVLSHQIEVLRGIEHARTAGFREVYERIEERAGPGLAWGISLRIKRGLAAPEAPGVYAKDSVYLAGRTRVRAWLDAGGDIRKLYVGKVGVDDPVDDWVRQGWVTPQPVPSLWKGVQERRQAAGPPHPSSSS
jgi:hypothetical protein